MNETVGVPVGLVPQVRARHTIIRLWPGSGHHSVVRTVLFVVLQPESPVLPLMPGIRVVCVCTASDAWQPSRKMLYDIMIPSWEHLHSAMALP